MIEISANELNQNIIMILSRIEKGERCVVVSEGKPVAEITPVKHGSPTWKRHVEKITLPNGVLAQDYVEAERNL